MSNKITLKIIALLLFIVSACDQKPQPSAVKSSAPQQKAPYNPLLDSKITVDVFKVDSIETNGSRGWGYDILIDDKIYIHQPTIPAIMGNNGFQSEEDARTAGDFMVTKIMNNILPPTVTPEELDSLGLLD